MKNEKNTVRQLWIMILAASVVSIAGAVIFTIDMIKQINFREAVNPLSDYLAGFSVGITCASFLLIGLIIFHISRAIISKKIFSLKIIIYSQSFAGLMILAGVSNNISIYLTEGASMMNFQVIVIAFLILIFAQMMKLGYRLQQEQELTI